jgi:hypothetical protein
MFVTEAKNKAVRMPEKLENWAEKPGNFLQIYLLGLIVWLFRASWLAKVVLVKAQQFAILLTDFGGGH